MTHPRFYNIITLAMLLNSWLLTSCSDSARSDGDDTPMMPGREISLFASATSGDAAQSASLLFWMAPDYEAFFTGTAPTGAPHFQLEMPQVIDSYKLNNDTVGTPFNTFKVYPSPSDTYVHVAGFAPSNAFDKSFTVGYATIPILKSKLDGLTDFLASNNDGKCRGSYLDPFIITGDKEHNIERMLYFRHLTACISFRATRSEAMRQKIGVRDVKIEIVNIGDDEGNNRLAVPKNIHLYHNTTATPTDRKWTYVAGDDSIPPVLSGLVPGNVVMDEGKQLSEFFVNTEGILYGEVDGRFEPFNRLTAPINNPKPSLTVNIEAKLFFIQDDEQYWEMRWEGLKVENWEVDPGDMATGPRFLPGYKYVVEINFNNTSVGLRAVQVPWVEGGTYYYPVYGGSSGS